MKKNLNILVATDYSDAIMNAEHYAVQLAKASGFSLRFLHVFEPPAANQTGSFDAEKIDYAPGAYELDNLKKHVANLLLSMNVQPGEVEYECVVREGNPARQITAEVKESFPDLVIMGTHGSSGFREFIMGTQTWKVIKGAGVPVLALPKDVFFTGIKNIVYATEYREGELPVVNYLANLAEIFQAYLTVLHITANFFTEDFEKKITHDFMQEVKSKVDYPKLQLKVEHATDIIEGLDTFAERNNTDLLVMSHERPYFMERLFSPNNGITRKMSVNTKTPLLVVPDYYNPDFEWFWRLFAVDYSVDTDL